jgi:hypothetical protein
MLLCRGHAWTRASDGALGNNSPGRIMRISANDPPRAGCSRRRISTRGFPLFSTAHSNGTIKEINKQCTFLLSFFVFAPLSTLINQPNAPSSPQSVSKLVTAGRTNGILYPLSFQSFADPFVPSSSNRALRISFNFTYLRTLPVATGGYTHPLSRFLSSDRRLVPSSEENFSPCLGASVACLFSLGTLSYTRAAHAISRPTLLSLDIRHV